MIREFHKPGFCNFSAQFLRGFVVSTWQYVLVILKSGKMAVSAKLPQQLHRQISKSWLAKLPNSDACFVAHILISHGITFNHNHTINTSDPTHAVHSPVFVSFMDRSSAALSNAQRGNGIGGTGSENETRVLRTLPSGEKQGVLILICRWVLRTHCPSLVALINNNYYYCYCYYHYY